MQTMQIMESFLKETKLFLSCLQKSTMPYKTIRIVMGNKTCDLDSAVCTLAQGLLEYNEAKRHEQTIAVIPVINITEKEFRLKTEVTYWLKFHNISLNLLTFRDQIDLLDIQIRRNEKLELILVDHHTLSHDDNNLERSVVKIIDHRPRDLSYLWNNVSLNIETVGSCATLVARNILQQNPTMLDNELSSLLRGPILVDTFNMSDATGQKTSVDIDILVSLEHLGKLSTDRTEIFNKLMEAKTDVSGLTLEDLLIKDLKVINDIPVVVFPFVVENFLMRVNAKETIKEFSSNRNSTVVILIGVEVHDNNVSRDIAVFHTLSNDLGNYILHALVSSKQPDLSLRPIKNFEEEGYIIYLYKQENLEATRKKILPIVQKTKLLYDTNKL